MVEYTPVGLKGETRLVPAPPRWDWQMLWRWSGAATTFVWRGMVCTDVERTTDRKTHAAENHAHACPFTPADRSIPVGVLVVTVGR